MDSCPKCHSFNLSQGADTMQVINYQMGMTQCYSVHHWCNACGNRWETIVGDQEKKRKTKR